MKVFNTANYSKLLSLIDLSGRVVETISNSDKIKNPLLKAIAVTSGIKKGYDLTFQKETWDYFNTAEWEFLKDSTFLSTLLPLFEKFTVKKFKPSIDSTVPIVICNIQGSTIGWVEDINAQGRNIYVKSTDVAKFQKNIGKFVWESLKSDYLIMRASQGEDESTQCVLDTDNQDEIILSERALTVSKHIEKFSKHKINRSILFYGPPGTGKTTAIRGISLALGYKTLRFMVNDLKFLHPSLVRKAIKYLKPDAIIFEDIDRAADPPQLLEITEIASKNCKLVISSANHIKKLSSALIRVGRFDELIEIKKLDEAVVLKIVENDKELFDKFKDYPIVSIYEIMKRVKALGKENALNNLGDIVKRFELQEKDDYEL